MIRQRCMGQRITLGWNRNRRTEKGTGRLEQEERNNKNGTTRTDFQLTSRRNTQKRGGVMAGTIRQFEDLKVWQEGMILVREVYRCLRSCRDFGLRDQLRRAAVSIPSNIAEGFERGTNKE